MASLRAEGIAAFKFELHLPVMAGIQSNYLFKNLSNLIFFFIICMKNKAALGVFANLLPLRRRRRRRDENEKETWGLEEKKTTTVGKLALKKKCGFILFGSQGHLRIDPALFGDIGYMLAPCRVPAASFNHTLTFAVAAALPPLDHWFPFQPAITEHVALLSAKCLVRSLPFSCPASSYHDRPHVGRRSCSIGGVGGSWRPYKEFCVFAPFKKRPWLWNMYSMLSY